MRHPSQMTKSRAEDFCQNVKHGCCRGGGGLDHAWNTGMWHLLKCTLNSKLNAEIGVLASLSSMFDTLPSHAELPAPITHLRVNESIIPISFEQLEVHLHVRYAVPPAQLNGETLFHVTVTCR
jgi:hypothetical protein